MMGESIEILPGAPIRAGGAPVSSWAVMISRPERRPAEGRRVPGRRGTHERIGSARVPRNERGGAGGPGGGIEDARSGPRFEKEGTPSRGGQDRRRPDDPDRRRQVQGLDEEDRLGANQGAHPPRRARRDARVLRVLRG